MDIFGAVFQLVEFVYKACSYYLANAPEAWAELNDIDAALGTDFIPDPPVTPTPEPTPEAVRQTAREQRRQARSVK